MTVEEHLDESASQPVELVKPRSTPHRVVVHHLVEAALQGFMREAVGVAAGAERCGGREELGGVGGQPKDKLKPVPDVPVADVEGCELCKGLSRH